MEGILVLAGTLLGAVIGLGGTFLTNLASRAARQSDALRAAYLTWFAKLDGIDVEVTRTRIVVVAAKLNNLSGEQKELAASAYRESCGNFLRALTRLKRATSRLVLFEDKAEYVALVERIDHAYDEMALSTTSQDVNNNTVYEQEAAARPLVEELRRSIRESRHLFR